MKPRNENQKDKAKLELTIKICQHLLMGKIICLDDSQIDCWPHTNFPIISPTEAKKRGLVLKNGQTPVCSYSFTLSNANGRGSGYYYLASQFKPKPIKKPEAA
ncbi:hypothetical protein [Shewanella xiamenensis]|uniref:hypothetical protein n=1 Tax=Shewanella xiamenensis TaxID=332186 RepID=UPI00313CB4F7